MERERTARKNGAEVESILSLADDKEYYEYLIEQSGSVDAAVEKALAPGSDMLFIYDFLGYALEAGADPTRMAAVMYDSILIDMLEKLVQLGAHIETERLLGIEYQSYEIVPLADTLLKAGLTSEQIIERASPETINNLCVRLLDQGVDIRAFIQHLEPTTIASNLPRIISTGVELDINALHRSVRPALVAEQLPTFIKAGADIDVPALFEALSVPERSHYLRQFLEVGLEVDTQELIRSLRPKERGSARGWLMAAGIDVEAHGPGFKSKPKKRRVHPPRGRAEGAE